MEILLHARKSFRRERLSMVDLLLLNYLDKLIFIFIIIFTYMSKQATLMKEVNCTEPSLQFVFPASSHVEWRQLIGHELGGAS
jgi:hypothetical protein